MFLFTPRPSWISTPAQDGREVTQEGHVSIHPAAILDLNAGQDGREVNRNMPLLCYGFGSI